MTPFIFFLFGLLLPSQLGRHFWPDFAYINGLRIDYLSPTVYFTDILIIVLAVLSWKKIGVFYKQIRYKKEIIFLTLTTLAVFYSLSPVKVLSLYRMTVYLKIVLIAVVFSHSEERLKKNFLKGLACSSFYMLPLAVAQTKLQGSLNGLLWFLGERSFTITTPGISTISLFGYKVLRPYGTFSHPNSLAAFYLIVFWLLAGYRMQLWAMVSLLIIFVSFSKITVIIFIVIWIFSELLSKKPCIPCVLGRFFFGLWAVFFAFLWKGDTGSVIKRLQSAHYSLNTLLQHPLGTGLGSYVTSSTPYLQPVHNIFLLFLTETGIIGLALIVLLSYFVFKQLKHHPKLITVCAAIFLSGFFDHHWLTLPQNQLLLGVIIGFIFVSTAKH